MAITNAVSKLEYPVLSKYWVYKYLTNLCVHTLQSASESESLSFSVCIFGSVLTFLWSECTQAWIEAQLCRCLCYFFFFIFCFCFAFTIYFYLSILGFIYLALGSYNRFLFGLHFCVCFLIDGFAFCCYCAPSCHKYWLIYSFTFSGMKEEQQHHQEGQLSQLAAAKQLHCAIAHNMLLLWH